jgi:hypothetical protein
VTEIDANTHRRPASPAPSEELTRLIDELGGPQAVADLVEQRLGIRLRRQAVSAWRNRGIPYRYRAALAIAARERAVGLPPNFLGEGEVR